MDQNAANTPPVAQSGAAQAQPPASGPIAAHTIPEAFQQAMAANQSAATPAAPAAPTPLSAADGDLIEKAWVEKAEAVMKTHQYDPYAQEKAAEELNQAYLKQRFGLDVSSAQDKG